MKKQRVLTLLGYILAVCATVFAVLWGRFGPRAISKPPYPVQVTQEGLIGEIFVCYFVGFDPDGAYARVAWEPGREPPERVIRLPLDKLQSPSLLWRGPDVTVEDLHPGDKLFVYGSKMVTSTSRVTDAGEKVTEETFTDIVRIALDDS